MITKTVAVLAWVYTLSVIFIIHSKPCAGSDRSVRLTLGTYNVEYFFDAHDDPYRQDEDFPVKSEQAKAALAQTIRSIDVDFLALQEVENQDVLEDFNRKYLGEMGYRFVWVNRRYAKLELNLAFLSRIPIRELTIYHFDELRLPGEGQSWSFARDLVGVTLEPAKNTTLLAFLVHFKSQGDSQNDPMSAKWRLAEAKQVHAKIAERLKKDASAWVAVIGDVNDTPKSLPYRQLTEPEDGFSLMDIHAGLSAEKRTTLLRQPIFKYQLLNLTQPIDYILVSGGLAQHLVSESIHIQPPANPKASDHRPVIATFDLPVGGPDGMAGKQRK